MQIFIANLINKQAQYFVVYFDDTTNKISRVENYAYDNWGGTSCCSSDIDSYRYGYYAKIYSTNEFVDFLNETMGNRSCGVPLNI